MEKEHELGVLIESGAQDWQVYQRSPAGVATLRLAGRWLTPQPHRQAVVRVRVVREADGEAVTRALDWARAATRADGTWSVRLGQVPQGGLYRLETVLQLDGGPVEWGQRGDMVHHLGVGDVWIIAGQSNAEGHGKAPVLDPPALGVHLFRACGQWALATHPLGDSTGTLYPANRLGSNPSHSPWLTFGKVLQAELGVPIGLIPASLGGSALASWVPGAGGILYENLRRYLADAGGAARGVVWYQGESDTGPEQRAVYAERFRKLVAGLRRTLRNPHLPVITTQLNRLIAEPYTSQTHGWWEEMRQIQRDLAHAIPDVFLISTLDLGLSDGIHTGALGNLAIGQRAAAAALGGAYGRDVKYLHPDCRRAVRRSARLVELHFDGVDERLHFENNIPEQLPFRVQDEESAVPIEGWSLSGRDRLALRLARPLAGRAVVVGAPTACPPAIVPVDISGHRPMLGFTQPVEQPRAARRAAGGRP
ncbi:MAG: sialate O-acetylesterase [Gemmatimonadota bacterium]